jgi:hypothetical protein
VKKSLKEQKRLREIVFFHSLTPFPYLLPCSESRVPYPAFLRRRLGMVDQRDAGQWKQVGANEIRLRF